MWPGAKSAGATRKHWGGLVSSGALIGALIMAFLRNGCQQMGWPNYIQEIIIGAIIVLAVAIDRWRHSRA